VLAETLGFGKLVIIILSIYTRNQNKAEARATKAVAPTKANRLAPIFIVFTVEVDVPELTQLMPAFATYLASAKFAE
jgi:hypothetical protein